MKSIEWIDRLIAEQNLPSDRQAALMIGMNSQLISKHRNGKAVTLDDEYAHNLEKALGLPDGKIVLDQHAERAANAGEAEIASMWRKLATSAAAITLGLILVGKSDHALAKYDADPVNQWVAGSSPAGGAKFSTRNSKIGAS